MSADKIKKQLSAELAKDKPDHRLIADLTEALLDQTEGEVRFSVDAQHINRLGLELVGKQETAVSELIKNAYDADATQVLVRFTNYDTKGGELSIIDDGNGMDAATIKNAWMRLSTNDKNENPVSPKFTRQRAGRKGIGRFSVQRLGKRLTLESEVEGRETGIRVQFDWDAEFVSGRNLTSIWSNIEEYPKESSTHGTRLYINDLRDKWTDAIFRKVWKSVVFLQPPFKVAKSRPDKKVDPGFSVIINGKSRAAINTEFSIEKNFLQHALATITGKIDEQGIATFKLKSKSLGIDEQHTPKQTFLTVGAVTLEARYFIYLSSVMPGHLVPDATKMGREFGGIRVYRNGFRVLPYGEDRDDWLRLGFDTGRRNLLIPANNHNFFGHVEIDQENNPLLEETSSREGLIENEPFIELRDFARMCVEWAALKVAEVRSRKQTAGQKNFISIIKKPTDAIGDAISKIDKVDAAGSGATTSAAIQIREAVSEVRAKLTTALEVAKSYEAETEAKIASMLEYEGMLRILASLGISISVFSHELKGARNEVDLQIALLEKFSAEAGMEVTSRLEKLKAAISRVFLLGGYVDSLVSRQESRELSEASIKGVVETFVAQFKDYLDRQGIEFSVEVEPPHLRTCPVHKSELDSVLFNFLTNSIKAMRLAGQKYPRIRISASKVGGLVNLRFEDNGGGVEEKNRSRVFDAFFTTSDPNPDDISGQGTGLGLKIVSDIANAYGGGVALAEPTAGFGCCFEFRLPAAEGQSS